MTINKSLSWNPHVDNVTKKANQTLAFLRRNIGMCSQDSKEQAYKTFVRPTLEYASTVWDPHTARNINAVEMVQRRAARFTTGNYHRTSSVSTILSALKWDSLQLRRARARTIMLFRIHNRLVDIFTRGVLGTNRHPDKRPHYKVPPAAGQNPSIPVLFLSMCH